MTAIRECSQGFTRRAQPLLMCEYDIDCDEVADLGDDTAAYGVGRHVDSPPRDGKASGPSFNMLITGIKSRPVHGTLTPFARGTLHLIAGQSGGAAMLRLLGDHQRHRLGFHRHRHRPRCCHTNVHPENGKRRFEYSATRRYHSGIEPALGPAIGKDFEPWRGREAKQPEPLYGLERHVLLTFDVGQIVPCRPPAIKARAGTIQDCICRLYASPNRGKEDNNAVQGQTKCSVRSSLDFPKGRCTP
jgi:hypothetical protein